MIAGLKAPNIGKNIARVREIQGIKQDVLASALNVTQQAVSKIENSEKIDDETLERVAKALGVSAENIRSFSEEGVLNLIQNNGDNSTGNYLIGHQYNQVDKLVELYNQLLQEKDERIAMLNEKINQLEKK